MQLDHYNNKFVKRTFPVTLVCDNVTNAANVGSLFRIADAFGVEKLVFCGEHVPMGRKMSKSSRATESAVAYEIFENISEVIAGHKLKGAHVISLEITDNSTPIHKVQFSKNNPILLVVGDENFGVSEDILGLSDAVIHIEMFGQNSSMNVVQATNIALYEITKQIM